MNATRVFLFVFAGLVLVNTRAAAVTVLVANITNDQETAIVTPTTTTGAARPVSFGTATFVLNDAMTELSFTATIFNIDVTGTQTPDTNDNLGAAHIHASPTVVPGVNGPVVWGFFGLPNNNTNPADGTVVPFATGVGGTFTGTWNAPEGNGTTLTAQLANILGSHSYINFHTAQFGGGEIRGAIIPSTPDAGSTLALLGCACAGLLGLRRKLSRSGSNAK